MRAMDCKDQAGHDDMHITGSTDDDLVEQAKLHRDEYHPDLSDDQIRELVAQNAYDE